MIEDELIAQIRHLVQAHVRPEWVEEITRLVTLTLANLMADPHFVLELSVVRQLQQQLSYLHQENLILKQALTSRRQAAQASANGARKKAAPRKAPAKKAPARPKVAPRRTTAAPKVSSMRASFNKGAHGR